MTIIELEKIMEQQVDTLWVLISAILVFIMQAGFMCLEAGLSRKKNNINVALKNIADFGVSVSVFWAVGFGIMFGSSFGGIFGTDGFFFVSENALNQSFFVFQAMFVATAASIISGVVAERLKFFGYLYITFFTALLIYPVAGHWAWADLNRDPAIALINSMGWLGKIGFVDFAGSTIVHSVGGWIALSAAIVIGPRFGRFKKDNKLQKFNGSNLPLAALGTLILWFGWFGFNGGSNGALDDAVPLILVNTFLSAAAGLIASLAFGYLILKKVESHYIINGPLAGLVSITAACHAVDQLSAIAIGVIGGIIASYGNSILEKFKIDDVVGAIPVHLFAGIWGTLAVALFGNADLLGTDLTMGNQLKVQIIGILSIGAYSFCGSYILLFLINFFIPLRVTRVQEELGLNIVEHNASTDNFELLKILKKQMETKDLSLRGPQDPFTDAGQIGFYYNRIMQELEESKIELDKWRKRILSEINLAAEVQQSLLPTVSLDKYPIAGINIPLGEISGDFFDYIPVNNKLYFTLGDVSGKGVNAGIVMAKASTLFKIFSKQEMSPQDILYETNNELVETSVQGMFITMIVGVYDVETKMIEWSNAGHQPPLVRDQKGQFIEYTEAGIPVGVVKQDSAEIFSTTSLLLKDKRLFIFTDGITEATNNIGEELGVKGIKNILEKNKGLSTKREVEKTVTTIQQITEKLNDDLTLLVIG